MGQVGPPGEVPRAPQEVPAGRAGRELPKRPVRGSSARGCRARARANSGLAEGRAACSRKPPKSEERRRGPMPPEGGLRDQAFPRWAGRARGPPFLSQFQRFFATEARHPRRTAVGRGRTGPPSAAYPGASGGPFPPNGRGLLRCRRNLARQPGLCQSRFDRDGPVSWRVLTEIHGRKDASHKRKRGG